MILDRYGSEARPGERSACPSCTGQLIAKCGTIVTWHWAHDVADCDPWSEPESEWHLDWKRYYRDVRGATIECVRPPHRADVVLTSGIVVELQAGYLDAEQIARREAFYGSDMVWLYRCHWADRLHYGERGFWWKHGAKSMATHRRPVWWDMGDELIRVRLNVVSNDDVERVLGRVVDTYPSPMRETA